MADPKDRHEKGGQETDKNKDRSLDRPDVSGGVPDAIHDGEAKGTPNSDREKTEKAGTRDA